MSCNLTLQKDYVLRLNIFFFNPISIKDMRGFNIFLFIVLATILLEEASPSSNVEDVKSILQCLNSFAENSLMNSLGKNGFVLIDGEVYYIGTSVRMTWWNAVRLCNSFNMRLINLDSPKKYKNIYDIIYNNTSVAHVYIFQSGVRVNKESYVWTSTGEEVTYLPWAKGQPTNEPEQACLCASVRHWSGVDGLHDCGCSDLQYFACEYKRCS